MKNVYYDGDSYSCTLSETTNTGILLQEHFGGTLNHYGHIGKTPEKIIRTAIRHSLSVKEDYIYFIGIGVPHRVEIFVDDTNYTNYPNDWMIEEHSAKTLSVEKVNVNIFPDHDFCLAKVLHQLVVLNDFLEYHNKKFIIHNLGINYYYDTEFDFGKLWANEVDKRPKIINFFSDSLHDLMDKNKLIGFDYDLYKYNAHPTDEGHKMYAEYLLKKYKEIYNE